MLDIKSLRDRYSGERVFILGNGPSLTDTPLEKLESEYTIGMTQIGKLYTDTKWRPSFYYNALGPDHPLGPDDKNIVLQNTDNDTICFLSYQWSNELNSDEDVYYFTPWPLYSSPFEDFNIDEIATFDIDFLLDFWTDDIKYHIYHYHSMYGAIQLAAHLGFDEIYFIGCDLGMEYSNPHMIFESGMDPYRYEDGKWSFINDAIDKKVPVRSLVNGIAMKSIQKFNNSVILNNIFDNKRNDHFTSGYLDHLVIHDSVKDEKDIKKGHVAAKKICESKGIKMYNATIGGDLEIYDRVDIYELFAPST